MNSNFLSLMKIGDSTEYYDIFLDLQDLQIYSLTSQESTEQEYISTFNRLYPGSKDTVKIVNSNFFHFNEDWAFNIIFRYFPGYTRPPNL